MATTRITTNFITADNSFFYLHEDATKSGYNNLTMSADRFELNPKFNFTTNHLINARGGDDVIGLSSGNDIVYGGSGNDTIATAKGNDEARGGSGTDTIYGGAGNDRLFGDSGNDVIDGGTGQDVIFGGAGNDILTGGYDSDKFIFNLGEGADTVADFTRGQDMIILDNQILSTMPDTHLGAYDIGAALVTVTDMGRYTVSVGPYGYDAVLMFNTDTHTLSYDADGLAGSGAAVDLAILDGVNSLSGADFFAPAPF